MTDLSEAKAVMDADGVETGNDLLDAIDAVNFAQELLGHVKTFVSDMIGNNKVHKDAWAELTSIKLLVREIDTKLVAAEKYIKSVEA